MHINDLRKHFLCLIHHAEEKMKPSTALGIILDLVSNSQLLGSIVTQICVDETLTINLRGFFFPCCSVWRMYQLFHGEISQLKPY